jgi:hypothetical protein|tara:strand:- start:9791 stop:9913 length:123 start_codon:yes stop_codon:yes gene_type:complete
LENKTIDTKVDQDLAKDIKRLAKAMEQLVKLIKQTIKENQ